METLDAYREKFNEYSRDQLLEQIVELNRKIVQLEICLFSSKKEHSNGMDTSGMRGLFDEAEATASVEVDSAKDQELSGEQDKENSKPGHMNRGKRKPLAKNLPRRRIEVDLSEQEKICPKHQKPLIKIGENITEKLEIVPARSYVAEIAVLKYKCDCCEKEEHSLTIKSAKRGKDLIPKSFASPSLLAYIAVSKFDDALPLYRLEEIFARYGIELSRATMARWMLLLGDKTQALINLIHEELIESSVLHCDETLIQVLKEANRRPEQKSYMWCLGRRLEKPLILFRYFDNRSKKAGSELLTDFKGKLICDAYKVYSSLAKHLSFTISSCFAHARRKFWLAEKAAKKAGSSTKSPLLASQALAYIKQLYLIEKQAQSKAADEVLALRTKKALPILGKFHQWLLTQQTKVLPKSAIGKAIDYTLAIWDSLTVYCQDPNLAIDNNWLESHLRPFVIGRKNWLFACTPKGADASANLYSLIESAKLNGLCPYSYLTLIFKELPKAESLAALERLLPHKAGEFYELEPYNKPK